MTFLTLSVPGAGGGRSSPDPSLPTQLSLIDCPNLTPEIPDNQEDVMSTTNESSSEPDAIPPIQFQALRARQYLRKHYTLGKDSNYGQNFYRNWETVKHCFSFLIILANLYKEDEYEEDWPLEWNDDCALTFFLAGTAASWTLELSNAEREEVKRLSHAMADLITVDWSDTEALEVCQDEVADILASITPVEEADIPDDY
ncbi:uncharacterized protein FSUBG_11032 [Fusarium subglutinans]|uniref:Uncharacterized protein n=1 Tax=Gibberella subglutinans TaxID=42677 RepID=A0A8H5LBA4_GIBSU|nr:uncharacterized protein FSUBG_11032 [Fusarium subglutinans]KAF5589830.1 hypothetical protein FSUBG_11032 [Fusarium subglutinans]